jgi:hypothetical protein
MSGVSRASATVEPPPETSSGAGAGMPRCALAREECRFRSACELEARRLASARAGNRAEFDALFDRYFARVHSAACRRTRDAALAEHCTRAVLEAAFAREAVAQHCAARVFARLHRLLSPQRALRAAAETHEAEK